MAVGETEWRRVAERIAAERGRQHITPAQLAYRAGLSIRTVEYLEEGQRQRYRRETIARVEDALGWGPGSVDRVRVGQPPIYSYDRTLSRVRDLWPLLTTEEQDFVAELVDLFARR